MEPRGRYEISNFLPKKRGSSSFPAYELQIGPDPMPRVFIKTYGCQMNERDSEQVAQMLMARGYQMTGSEQDADVVLLNTCSVRDMAEQKAIGKMGMMGRLREERPHMVFGFLGCMAQSRGAELARGPGRVDLVVGTQKFHRVADYVDEIFARRGAGLDGRSAVFHCRYGCRGGARRRAIRDHLLAPRQVTAFVSIMQGCNMHCTFCIVPSTRGAGAQPGHRGDRRGGEGARRARRARGDAPGPDRQSVWAA